MKEKQLEKVPYHYTLHCLAVQLSPSAPTERAQVSGSNRDGEDGFSVLDVIKAIAPLLIIIGLAFAMLVLGYLFLPPNLSSSFCKHLSP